MSDTPEPTTEKPVKPKNSNLIIIFVVVVVVLAALGFAAQKLFQKTSRIVGEKMGEKVAENMIESAAGGKADVDFGKDGMTVKTDEGTFSAGTSLPSDWPKDVPVYPGSQVVYSGSNDSETGGSGYGAVLSTDDDYLKVDEYYSRELVVQGWLVSGTQNVADTKVITATKDNRALTVAAVTEDGTTSITLGVNSENE